MRVFALVSLLLPLAAFGFYDPSVGRWTTRDPIEEQGGVNLYAFCQNDPVNRYDKCEIWRKCGWR